MVHTHRFDNVHILLWLLNDTCWMLEWKILGSAMIVPTLAVAIYMAARSTAERAFWINLAICSPSRWACCRWPFSTSGADEPENLRT